jgi:hypothetical protein
MEGTDTLLRINTGQVSGFGADYQNTLPDNTTAKGDQAHHFTAFFQLGYIHTNRILGSTSLADVESNPSPSGSQPLTGNDRPRPNLAVSPPSWTAACRCILMRSGGS